LFKKIAIISCICLSLSGFTISAKTVVPSGEIVGVKLELAGLLVTNVQKKSFAEKVGLKNNDFIKNFNSIESFLAEIKDGETVTILRSGNEKEIVINAYIGDFGASFKTSISGIGTLSYYDTETNQIFAIGHEVVDISSGLFLPWLSGVVKSTSVSGIIEADKNSPAILKGTLGKNILGNVISNTGNGIIAKSLIDFDLSKQMEIGMPNKDGAKIYATLDNNLVKEYDIIIEEILNYCDDKNIVFKVIDEDLLTKTRGIAQGMSGCPIVQDGKLVGVVTHVFANDFSKGYGIMIE